MRRLVEVAAPVILYGVFAASVFSVVPAMAQAQSAFRADAEIQTELSAAFSQSQPLQSQQITAAVILGDVTLSGTVADAATKQLAGQVASRIGGVRSVENNLVVDSAVAAQSAPAPQGDDQPPPPPPYDQGVSQPDQPGNNPQQVYDQQSQQDYPPQGLQYYGGDQGYGPPSQPSGPVTIPAGTLLNLRTIEVLDSQKTKSGTYFQATVANPVFQGNILAIPRGAVLTGQVIGVKKPGDLAGKPGLQIQVTSLNLGGQSYPLTTDTWTSEGPGKGGYSAANTAGGAGTGALIGAIAGGGPGAAIGAVAGGIIGLAASAGTKGPRIVIPAEAVLTVHLTAPVTVTPVSNQEAQRLSASVPQYQQPRLIRRPVHVYGYPYPYPYYRPYYYYPRY